MCMCVHAFTCVYKMLFSAVFGFFETAVTKYTTFFQMSSAHSLAWSHSMPTCAQEARRRVI